MTASAPHQALRTTTAESHARLDALFAGFDLETTEGYGHFLQAHAAAALAVEAALESCGIAAELSDWPTRRRAGALLADLADLDIAPPETLPPPSLAASGAAWGAAYVLEGSRLGGAVLAKRVGPELPRRYLARTLAAGSWRAFLQQMEQALTPAPHLAEASRAALETFALFETAGRQQLETAPRD